MNQTVGTTNLSLSEKQMHLYRKASTYLDLCTAQTCQLHGQEVEEAPLKDPDGDDKKRHDDLEFNGGYDSDDSEISELLPMNTYIITS